MKRRKSLITAGVVCLALIVALLPFASACAPKTEAEKVLKIGMSTPSTGKAAEKGAPMGHANLDAIKYINEELGGVEGHPIEVVWLDNGYDASKMVTNAKRFMDEGCLMFTTASSAMMTVAMESANRAEFPGLACFTSPNLYRPPQYIYGQLPDYGDDALAFATYYLQNIWKGTGKPKFALHLLNNSTGYGARDAFKAKADELGIEIVSTDEHDATTASEMESLTRIKAENPDVLYISSTPAPTAIIIKNAVDLGMYPGMTIGCGHASFTKALVDLAGADVVEGVYGVFPTANWGDDVPGMAKVVEYCEKYHPNDAGNLDYVTSWAQSLICAEALRLAVQNAGYDVLAKGDVESWRAMEAQGIQKLKDYDVEGLHGPVSYTPGDNRLAKSVRVFQVQNGVITPISDWVDSPVVKYEEYEWFGK
ncbi:ABC transporter substrate-binding protein [Chloroflexota bacterium]